MFSWKTCFLWLKVFEFCLEYVKYVIVLFEQILYIFNFVSKARRTWKSQGGTSSILWALRLWETTQMKFPKAMYTTKAMLDYVYFDCWGPLRVPPLGGVRYFLSIINDYSSMTWVFMMKHKSEAFKIFKHWTILMKNQTWKTIKCLRTDNGLKFCYIEFNELCRDEGITI